jgi:hypothetical protein
MRVPPYFGYGFIVPVREQKYNREKGKKRENQAGCGREIFVLEYNNKRERS